jgi:hypothetical protein
MDGVSEPSATDPRPTQVTAAAWMIMVGSVFVVLMVWDRIAGLHSLDSQKSLQSVLDTPGIKGSGLQVSDLMAVVRVMSMIGAACATAMVILGYQTLQRSRGARVGLTVLAVPLFVCGLVTGGFVAAVVVAAVATLWLRPARLWFDGRPAHGGPPSHPSLAPRVPAPPTQEQTSQERPRHEQPHSDQPHHEQQQAAPPVEQPAPQQTPWPPSQLPPSQQQWGPPPVWAPPPTSAYDAWPGQQVASARLGRRPAALVAACVVTWVVSGLVLLALLGSIVVLATDSAYVLDGMHRQNPTLAEQGMSDHAIVVTAFVMCGLFALWALAVVVVAAFCLLGRRWAWYALVVSSGALAAFSVLGAIASLLMLVPLAGSVAVLVLLLRPEVRAWLR